MSAGSVGFGSDWRAGVVRFESLRFRQNKKSPKQLSVWGFLLGRDQKLVCMPKLVRLAVAVGRLLFEFCTSNNANKSDLLEKTWA